MLKEMRKKVGLSQSQLADLVGRKQSVVSSWENGKVLPDVLIIKKIALALNVSVEEVIKCFEEATEKENV